MKPVFQTKHGFPDGNCFMACVASILDITLDECPDLCTLTRGFEDGSDWGAIAREWAYDRGYLLVAVFPADDGYIKLPRGYCVVGGRAPMGQMHACVALDGEIVHDPTPGGTGISHIFDYAVLVPLMPHARLGVPYSQQVDIIAGQMARAQEDTYRL